MAAVLSIGGGLGASALHPPTVVAAPGASTGDIDAFVVQLFTDEAVSLTRLARLFVDDRSAAEDLVQEAFIRLARSADRIRDRAKAAAYLRSIVLNLARDHNRRGLVSLRHQLP
jgi:DNA-directed RNA polymerase specialized sigma24 family protein